METSNKYPCAVLMVRPTHFDVKYAINVHMLDQNGNLNTVDSLLAMSQWEALHNKYEQLGVKVNVIDDTEDLPDMVFCANTFLSFIDNGIHSAFLSNMHSKFRQKEVEVTQKWLKENEIQIYEIPSQYKFESMGDAIWNYETETLYGGYGFRTEKDVYDIIKNKIPKLELLALIDERFYHLDTCLSILNKDTACYVKEAFDGPSITILKRDFKNLIEISLSEAIDNFAANCHCPNGKDVIIQSGAKELVRSLKNLNLNIHEVETGEFMKSGGSVFCMKNMIDLK